jgi:hypothetical protein
MSAEEKTYIKSNPCIKCGSFEMEYDNYWKEYICEKCGWAHKKDDISSDMDQNNKVLSPEMTETEESSTVESDESSKILNTHLNKENEASPIIFDHPINLWTTISGILKLLCALFLLFLTDLLDIHKTGQSPLFFLGGLTCLIFFSYRLFYSGFRNLNFLKLKSIIFDSHGIIINYKKDSKIIKRVVRMDQKWRNIFIWGTTLSEEDVFLKISKKFFKSRKDRLIFIELLNNYK